MASEANPNEATCGGARSEKEPCFPPVAFITFVLSLAQSAMVLMGEAPDPETGRTLSNLPEAKHTIDILAMLDCKTRGNLGDEERDVLENILCELRMTFVRKQ